MNETEGQGIGCSLLKPISGAGLQTDVTAKEMQLEVLPTIKTVVKRKSQRGRSQWLHPDVDWACLHGQHATSRVTYCPDWNRHLIRRTDTEVRRVKLKAQSSRKKRTQCHLANPLQVHHVSLSLISMPTAALSNVDHSSKPIFTSSKLTS